MKKIEKENFFHNEELLKLEHNIEMTENGDVIVINGDWGFGKTEVIKQYKEKHNQFDFIDIDLWNSGFETNVLYYFYQEILSYKKKKENKKTIPEEFLTFFKFNVVFLPFVFLLFSFFSVNFWIPLFRKMLIKDPNIKFIFVDWISWVSLICFVLILIAYYSCYLSRNIVKFIIFKKNFNAFFYSFFMKKIIDELKNQNSFIIIEDIDRLGENTIKELTTVIDSLKKELEKISELMDENKCVFIVSFDVKELNRRSNMNQRKEYYFDKVEKNRVNMLMPENKILLQLKNFESKMTEFDLKVIKEVINYFVEYLTLRSIEKFVNYCKVERKDINNHNHITNLFVKYMLQEKYSTDIKSLENKEGVQFEINRLLNKDQHYRIFNSESSFYKYTSSYAENFSFLIETLGFHEYLPYKYPIYMYDFETLKKHELFVQLRKKNKKLEYETICISTLEELVRCTEKLDLSKGIKILTEVVYLKKEKKSERIKDCILKQKKCC